MNIEKHRERRKAYWTEYIDHVRSIGHHMPPFEEFLIAKLDRAHKENKELEMQLAEACRKLREEDEYE